MSSSSDAPTGTSAETRAGPGSPPQANGEPTGSAERRHVNPSRNDTSPSAVLAGRPSVQGVASVSVSVLLFGGLFALCVGATWATFAAFGSPAAVAVAGTGMVAYAFVLAQVCSRLGLF